MSRSGYSDDIEERWHFIMWRGAVASAIRGKRGQSFLREMLAALDAMEERRLIRHELQDTYDNRSVCAIGAVGRVRGVNMEEIDPEDREQVAGAFCIPPALAAEIVYMNDEWWQRETPEQRYSRMRQWVLSQLKQVDVVVA